MYWKFKHDHFQKGRPELLVNIKKTVQSASSDKQEITVLRDDIIDLKADVMKFGHEVEKRRTLVEDVMKATRSEVDSKKRKLTAANRR